MTGEYHCGFKIGRSLADQQIERTGNEYSFSICAAFIDIGQAYDSLKLTLQLAMKEN